MLLLLLLLLLLRLLCDLRIIDDDVHDGDGVVAVAAVCRCLCFALPHRYAFFTRNLTEVPLMSGLLAAKVKQQGVPEEAIKSKLNGDFAKALAIPP